MAWQRISPEVTVKSFKKCCISSAVEEIYDDMLWIGSDKGGHVRSGCEENEDTDCEDGDSDNTKVYPKVPGQCS